SRGGGRSRGLLPACPVRAGLCPGARPRARPTFQKTGDPAEEYPPPVGERAVHVRNLPRHPWPGPARRDGGQATCSDGAAIAPLTRLVVGPVCNRRFVLAGCKPAPKPNTI